MRRQIASVLSSAVLGFMASSALAVAQQRTAKACLERSGEPTKRPARPMESRKRLIWRNAVLVAHPLNLPPHRQRSPLSRLAPAMPGMAKSTPPSRILCNPSSIRLQTHFGGQWEPWWTRRVFMSPLPRRRRSGSICVVPLSESSRAAIC